MNVSDCTNAEQYIWGQVCDGWHLLKQQDLSVIQERVPAGAGEVKHFHSKARQFFFVLAGTATLEFPSHNVTFSSGQGVHVPPLIEHRFVNYSDNDVIFLVISAPSSKDDRVNIISAESL